MSAILCGAEKLCVLSLHDESLIVPCAKSCQATCSVPSPVTYGSAPMLPVLPTTFPLTETGVEKVTPWSSEYDIRTLLPFFSEDDPPVSLSHATYTRS